MITAIWIVVIVGVVAGGAMLAALAAQSKHQYDERLEVVPGVKSNAPADWAGSHSFEAKLHRRLGDAVRALRHQPTELGGSAYLGQRAALEDEALRIDARLMAVAALPESHRQARLDEVARLVTRYEEAIADLVTATLDEPGSLDRVISESEIKLRALEAARAEVERADDGHA